MADSPQGAARFRGADGQYLLWGGTSPGPARFPPASSSSTRACGGAPPAPPHLLKTEHPPLSPHTPRPARKRPLTALRLPTDSPAGASGYLFSPRLTQPHQSHPPGGTHRTEGLAARCTVPAPSSRLRGPRPQSPAVGQYPGSALMLPSVALPPLEARPSRAASALALCLASLRPRQAPIGAVLPVALGLASERSGEGWSGRAAGVARQTPGVGIAPGSSPCLRYGLCRGGGCGEPAGTSLRPPCLAAVAAAVAAAACGCSPPPRRGAFPPVGRVPEGRRGGEAAQVPTDGPGDAGRLQPLQTGHGGRREHGWVPPRSRGRRGCGRRPFGRQTLSPVACLASRNPAV